MGNGQKAQMRRERNAKHQTKTANSQLKVNEAAKNVICGICRQPFLCTSREKLLTEHAENKHSKTLKECFPNWVAPPAK